MLSEGLTYTSGTVVDNNNTAVKMGSGDMEVFATPSMVALMENAAMNAAAFYLESGQSTVGSSINVSHVKPSKIGAHIKATALLVGIESRKLTFKVSAEDDGGLIGEGEHIRYVVDRDKFLSKL